MNSFRNVAQPLEEENFRHLYDGSGMVYWELELASGRFTYVSPLAAEMLGYPLSAWYQDGFWAERIHADDRERAVNSYAQAAAHGESCVVEYRMVALDGETVWVRDMISPHAETGQPKTLRGFMLDISDRRLIEESLLATLEKLARSNIELERFAYIASHDLQEPLRTIVSFSQLIERQLGEQADREVRDYLGLIMDAGTRMRSLIHDLLEYARSGGNLAMTPGVRLNDIVDTARSNLFQTFLDSGARIEVGPLPEITCDRARILQVFENLLSNAVKFRYPGRPPLIRVGCEMFDEVVAIYVEDNGIGIDSRHFDDVFLAFKRLHHHSVIPGSGIGLAIVRRNVEMHGGKTWLESRAGDGTTFHFTLPIGPPAL